MLDFALHMLYTYSNTLTPLSAQTADKTKLRPRAEGSEEEAAPPLSSESSHPT